MIFNVNNKLFRFDKMGIYSKFTYWNHLSDLSESLNPLKFRKVQYLSFQTPCRTLSHDLYIKSYGARKKGQEKKPTFSWPYKITVKIGQKQILSKFQKNEFFTIFKIFSFIRPTFSSKFCPNSVQIFHSDFFHESVYKLIF